MAQGLANFQYLGLSQVSKQIFKKWGREKQKPAVAELCYL